MRFLHKLITADPGGCSEDVLGLMGMEDSGRNAILNDVILTV